ncbi:tRNA lysidine(34) synthetase TilS [Aurantibacter sp.]|uniref:tRNA lysidine(34) synthetase TilS n=1 Tax=Aurantibacter sp. TaxID=2807103 RepID=UPI0035C8349A
MLQEFKVHINNQFSFLNEKKLLVAISGGLDSVVLAYLCKSLKFDFSLAHCNFSLRDKESNTDETFVKQLAKDLDVEIFTKTFPTEKFAKKEKLSIQLAARKLRYNWFEEILEREALDYVLTAHHADDNLETLLINLSRGTGIEGLTGIPPLNNNIVRPLLPFSRKIIKAYALEQQINWREDSSNASTKYLRNKLRHDVIPVLKDINPNILQNLNTTISNLNDTKSIVVESLKAVLKRAVISKTEGETVYRISEFKKIDVPKAYIHEIFKVYGFTAFNDIVDLLDAQSGKIITSKTHQLLKDRETLILTKIDTKKEFEIVVNSLETIKTPLGKLVFEKVSNVGIVENNSIFVDAKMLNFPLTVSSKQEGDYFYPSGMNGKKKISKYFKDIKLSLIAKEKALILRSSNQVVWVINYRLDNRFKVTKSTKKIIKISLI